MSERAHEEDIRTNPPPAMPRRLLSPRRQIALIAIGIALFNAVLIGVLVYLVVVY